jgi:hypothetical protein
MRIHDLGTTTQYECPTWTGNGFVEEVPQALWTRLPESLRKIALEDIRLSNNTESILESRERGIVLLALRTGPVIDRTSNSVVKVHTRHEYGNYCYDGTKATYEDIKTGCFLAFEDPDYKEQVY